MKIQIPFNCIYFKQSDNLNLTCNKDCKRCVIYYDLVCPDYKEKDGNESS